MGAYGLFNLPNQKLGEIYGSAYVNPDSGNDVSDWEGVTFNEVYQWSSICYKLYFVLNLAGYAPAETHFKISNKKYLKLEHDSMELSLVEQEVVLTDVYIGFSEIKNASDEGLGLPMGDYRENTTGDESDISLSLTAEEQNIYFQLGRDTDTGSYYDTDRTSEDYATQLNFLVNILEQYLLSVLMLRWWQAQPPTRPIETPDFLLNTPFSNGVLDEQASTTPEQALTPDNQEVPAGLLWLINPEFWDENLEETAPVIQKVAEKIWNEFSLSETESVYPLVFGVGGGLTRNFIDLKNRFPGINNNLVDRFEEEVRRLPGKKNIEIPERLVENFDVFSYFELIMVMINYGLIEVSSLPDSEVTADDSTPTMEFYWLEDESAVEIFLLGWGPIRLQQVHPVYDYDYDVQYFAQDSFCWEFLEGDGDDPHTLLIVAAPGVEISSIENAPANTQVKIYRVQDHALVPPWFDAINAYFFEAPYTLEYMPENAFMDLREMPEGFDQISSDESEKVPAFHIKPKQDGVVISYPSLDVFGPIGDHYSLRVELSVDQYLPDQRFSFYIEKINEPWDVTFENQFELFQHFVLVVHYTEGVKITVQETNPDVSKVWIDGVSRSMGWVKYLFYRVDYAFHEEEQPDGMFETVLGPHPVNAIFAPGNSLVYQPLHGYPIQKSKSVMELPRYSNITDEIFGSNSSGTFSEDIVDAISDIFTDPIPGSLSVVATSIDIETGISTTSEIGIATISNIPSYVSTLSWGTWAARLFVDVAIGFVPYVGDAADIAEVLQAIETGKDKWGEPVSNFELKLMIAGAALPLVSSGAIKAISR